MTATPGGMLSHYRLLEKIGEGGMGVVWKAMDTLLDREVAVKFLPDRVAKDPTRLARFEREARVLASVSHPNVAAIYGVEATETGACLVLEHVPGETLEDLAARGPLPLADALEIMVQIAEGLEAAHDVGIIHRDLKPANVKITPDGRVKVLDFGLAKDGSLFSGDRSDSPGAFANSPTITTGGTGAGMILGTVATMSPEQARGKPVDKRTDIWAYGCIFYELLAGAKAFPGETVTDVLGAILHTEPDWSRIPAKTPAPVRALLRRCFEKDPKRRLRDLGDARIEIQECMVHNSSPSLNTHTMLSAPVAGRSLAHSLRRRVGAWVGIGAIAGLFAGAALRGSFDTATSWRKPALDIAVPRLSIAMPSSLQIRGTTLSPDGTTLAILAVQKEDGPGPDALPSIYLRRLDRFDLTPLHGSEGAAGMMFSPDGQWLAFVAAGARDANHKRLFKAPLDGSVPPQLLTSWDDTWSGAVWAEPDQLIVSTKRGSALVRIPAAGGAPSAEIPIHCIGFTGEVHVQRPLRGTKSIVAQALSYNASGYNLGIALVDPDTGNAKIVVEDGAGAVYTRTGHLVWSRHEALLAAPFDLARQQLTGPPTTILDGLRTGNSWAHGRFDISPGGTLVYAPGGRQGGNRRLAITGPDGKSIPWSEDRRAYENAPSVSRDGRWLATVITNSSAIYEIWVSEVARPALRRFVAVAGTDVFAPVFSPDGAWLAYAQLARNDQDGIWVRRVDGRGEPVRITAATSTLVTWSPSSWSPDGSIVLATRRDEKGNSDVVAIPFDARAAKAGEVMSVVATAADEQDATFSPDGRWIAFLSDANGRPEIYVSGWTLHAAAGSPVPVSINGGRRPVWARDGRSLVWADRKGKLQRAEISGEDGLHVSVPAPWTTLANPRADDQFRSYDLLPDGRALFVEKGEDEDDISRFDVVLNWFDELERRAGAAGAVAETGATPPPHAKR